MDWKKEYRLSDLFRRGAKGDGQEPVEPEPVEPKPEAAAGADPGSSGSVWKKEIRVSRLFKQRKKEDEPPSPPPAVFADVPPKPAQAAEWWLFADVPGQGAGSEPAPKAAAPAAQPPEAVSAEEPPEAAPAAQPPEAPSAAQPPEAVSAEEPPQPTPPAKPSETVAAAQPPESAPVPPPPAGEPSEAAPQVEPAQPVTAEKAERPAEAESAAPEPELVEAVPAASEGGEAPRAAIWKRELKISDLFRRKKAAPESEVGISIDQPHDQTPTSPEPAPSAEPESSSPPEAGGEPEAPAAPEPVPTLPLAAPVPETSIWRKEIRVSDLVRRRREQAQAASERASADTALSEGADDGTAESPASVWKREIRFGRRRGRPGEPDRGRPGRMSPLRRDRSAEGRAAPALARRPKAAGQLPNVPLVRALNLLPREEAKARRTRVSLPTVGAGLAALAVVGGLTFVYFYEQGRVQDRKGAAEDLQAQIAAIEIPEPVAEGGSVALAGEALARAGALQTALDGRIVWDRLLRDLSLILPDDVWLQSVESGAAAPATATTTTAGAPASAALPATIAITGRSKSQESIGKFLARLGVLAELSSVRLESANLVEVGSEKVLEFSIAAALKTSVEVAS
jgi:Tfp pilus assembly protein PilN